MGRIEIRQRFIRQDPVRLSRQHPRHFCARALTTGEAVNRAVGEVQRYRLRTTLLRWLPDQPRLSAAKALRWGKRPSAASSRTVMAQAGWPFCGR